MVGAIFKKSVAYKSRPIIGKDIGKVSFLQKWFMLSKKGVAYRTDQ